jgi:hypothetical protein
MAMEETDNEENRRNVDFFQAIVFQVGSAAINEETMIATALVFSK